MNVLGLIILIIIGIILIVIRRKRTHVHDWKYMYSTEDNAYSWFNCPTCQATCRTRITDNGQTELRIYTKKPKR
jgi:hypothetical protein